MRQHYVPAGTESARKIASANSPLHPKSRSKYYKLPTPEEFESIAAHNNKIEARKRLKRLRKTGFGKNRDSEISARDRLAQNAFNAAETGEE